MDRFENEEHCLIGHSSIGFGRRIRELEERIAALTLHWTATKPTSDGWYWLKDGSSMTIVQVEIGNMECFKVENVYFCGTSRPSQLHQVAGEWAGPIAAPQERTGS